MTYCIWLILYSYVTHILLFSRRKLVLTSFEVLHGCRSLVDLKMHIMQIFRILPFFFLNTYNSEGLYSCSTCFVLCYCIYCIIFNPTFFKHIWFPLMWVVYGHNPYLNHIKRCDHPFSFFPERLHSFLWLVPTCPLNSAQLLLPPGITGWLPSIIGAVHVPLQLPVLSAWTVLYFCYWFVCEPL